MHFRCSFGFRFDGWKIRMRQSYDSSPRCPAGKYCFMPCFDTEDRGVKAAENAPEEHRTMRVAGEKFRRLRLKKDVTGTKQGIICLSCEWIWSRVTREGETIMKNNLVCYRLKEIMAGIVFSLFSSVFSENTISISSQASNDLINSPVAKRISDEINENKTYTA